MADPVRLCFVCLGNICRSPTAAGVMQRMVDDAGLADRVLIDSAGTGDWHVGDPPDRRAAAEAKVRGIVLDHRARQFTRSDFARFDLVLAMDRENLGNLRRLAPDDAARAKIHLLRSFDPDSAGAELGVPDPYYGGDSGFTQVYDVIEAACAGLLAHLRAGPLATG